MAQRKSNGFPAVGAVLLLISAAAAWQKRAEGQGASPQAAEGARGRKAAAPWDIPEPGWKDILIRTYEEANKDRLLAVAAGVAFYGLLALFPAITAFVSFYGLFADPHAIESGVANLAAGIPAEAMSIVTEQVQRIASAGSGRLSVGFVLGLGIALWSANAGMKAMFDALNVAYGEEEKRGFIRLNAVSLAFTLGAIGVLLIALFSVAVVPVILSKLIVADAGALLLQWGRWPILLAIIVLALSVVYRFGPSRREPKWRWVTPGGLAAAVLWIVGSSLFSFYLSHFANYNATYGSLGAVIGLLMWMWLTSAIVLLGAELNAQTERQTVRDSTVGGAKPLGARQAFAADTIGPARTGQV